MRPLDVPFVAEAPTPVSISPRALGRVHGAWYSVPCVGRLTAWFGATTVAIVGRDGTRTFAPRSNLHFLDSELLYRQREMFAPRSIPQL